MSFIHETYEDYLAGQLKITRSSSEMYLDKDAQERSIEILFDKIDRDKSILDVGCGSAIGLTKLRSMKFKNLFGLDLDAQRADLCLLMGFEVRQGDMASIPFSDKEIDIIFSSHSFEHNRDPVRAIKEFLRVAHESIIIVPFPDFGTRDMHPASDIIGTRIVEDRKLVNDRGEKFKKWLTDNGAKITDFQMWPEGLSYTRQDEIWVKVTSP